MYISEPSISPISLSLSLSLSLPQSIQSHELVSVCAVATVSSRSAGHHLLRDTTSKHFPTERRLVAFTVPVSRQSHLTPHLSSEWVEELMSGLVQSLPGHIIPDVIMPVHYLPCNQHGTSHSSFFSNSVKRFTGMQLKSPCWHG